MLQKCFKGETDCFIFETLFRCVFMGLFSLCSYNVLADSTLPL